MSLSPQYTIQIRDQIQAKWDEFSKLSESKRCAEVMRFLQQQNVHCVWFQWPIPKLGTISTDLEIYIPAIILEVALKTKRADKVKMLCVNIQHEFTGLRDGIAPIIVKLELSMLCKELCYFIAGHRWNGASMLKFRQDTRIVLTRYKALKTEELTAFGVMRQIAIELQKDNVSMAGIDKEPTPTVEIEEQIEDSELDEDTPPPPDIFESPSPPAVHVKRFRPDDEQQRRSAKRSRPWPAPEIQETYLPNLPVTYTYSPFKFTRTEGLDFETLFGSVTDSAISSSYRSTTFTLNPSSAPQSSSTTTSQSLANPSLGGPLRAPVQANDAYTEKLVRNKRNMTRFIESVETCQLQAKALDAQIKIIAGQPSALAAQATAVLMQLDSLAGELREELEFASIEKGSASLPVQQPSAASIPPKTAVRECTSCDGWMVLRNPGKSSKITKAAYYHVGCKCPNSPNGYMRYPSLDCSKYEYILDCNSAKHQGFLATLGYAKDKLVPIPDEVIYPGSNMVPFDEIPRRQARPRWSSQKRQAGRTSISSTRGGSGRSSK